MKFYTGYELSYKVDNFLRMLNSLKKRVKTLETNSGGSSSENIIKMSSDGTFWTMGVSNAGTTTWTSSDSPLTESGVITKTSPDGSVWTMGVSDAGTTTWTKP